MMASSGGGEGLGLPAMLPVAVGGTSSLHSARTTDGVAHAEGNQGMQQQLAMYDVETKRLEDALRTAFEEELQALTSKRDQGRGVLLARWGLLARPPPGAPAQSQSQTQTQTQPQQRKQVETEVEEGGVAAPKGAGSEGAANDNPLCPASWPPQEWKVGMKIDAKDKYGGWYEAKVLKVEEERVRVHFRGWGREDGKSRYDEWATKDDLEKMAAYQTHSAAEPDESDDAPDDEPYDVNTTPRTRGTSSRATARKRRKWTPRLTAAQQARYQKSEYLGVVWDGQHWRAEIVDHRGKSANTTKMATTHKTADISPRVVGYFEEEADAAKAFDIASKKLMAERFDGGRRHGASGAKRKLNFCDLIDRHKSECSDLGSRMSRLRGVKFVADDGCGREQWLGVIRGTDGIVRNIGQFETEAEAGRAYDRAAIEVHGIKARLNFGISPSMEPTANLVRSPIKKPSATTEQGQKRRRKSSKYRGLTWHDPPSKRADRYWVVQISINGKSKTIRFVNDDPSQGKRMRDEVEAAKYYDQLAIKYHGHNAFLNFPEPYWEQMRALQIEARKRGDFGGCSSSIYRGVSKNSAKGKSTKKPWVATIAGHGHLGSFSDEISAARAYDQAALRVHGYNAKLNFPSEEIAHIEQRKMDAERHTTHAKKSAYRGVKWDIGSRKWTVMVDGCILEPHYRRGCGSVGLFSDDKSAAIAYDRAWLEKHGDLHNKQQKELLNYPESSWAWFRQQTNQRNGSKYLGVLWARHANNGQGQWKATIKCTSTRTDCKTAYATTCRILGFFDDQESAARAYDKAALGLNPNVPDAELNFAKDRASVTSAEIERKRSYGDACHGSRFRGVTWLTRDRRWCAQITRNKGRHHITIGTFDNEEDAARAYDKEALNIHGALAILNFPKDHASLRWKLQQDARRNGVAAGRGGSSAFRGVCKRQNRWTATINIYRNASTKKTLFLGSFCTEVMAARAYDKAANAIVGANAILNFPPGVGHDVDDHDDDEDAFQPASGSCTNVPTSDNNSIEVHVGRRLEYTFKSEGVSNWYAGIVERKTDWPGWYEVAFDDGECMSVLIDVGGHGSAWRWTSRRGVHLHGSGSTCSSSDMPGGKDADVVSSAKASEDSGNNNGSESDDEFFELQRKNLTPYTRNSIDSGAYGSERLATSVFVSV